MAVLITGVAGFIGMHVAQILLDRGEAVVGVDSINDYYDPLLKRARLQRLLGREGFDFREWDIADKAKMLSLARERPDIDRAVNLAAQAGVRYSLTNPFAYTHANVDGFLSVLELVRKLKNFRHLVFASSSSVYGANAKLPFSVDDRADHPISIYAATKRANELMAHSYAHLYRIKATGLRYFTVYGPWGRPDMSAYIFTKAIFEGRKIPVFNDGKMSRDFTFVDDIARGTVACLDKPPTDDGREAPCRIYNIGNNKSEPLMRFIQTIEQAVGKKAEIDFQPMQPGDVPETYADIDATMKDFGFAPSVSIDEGIPRFVRWFREYHKV